MFKPSIYTILFEHEGRHYLYNSRSNFFSEIDADFHTMLSNGDFSKIPKEVMGELLKKEIVCDEKDLYDFFFREKLKFHTTNYNPVTLQLTIAPTTACNFDCHYCFEPKKNPRTITDKVVCDIVKFVEGHTDAKYINLEWYGGEPLLAFGQIKKLYAALSSVKGKNITWHSIVTNGYLINQETVDFFKETRLNHIQITLDGPKKRHDKSRCLKTNGEGTFDRIVRNIQMLTENIPELNISIRVNIDKTNFEGYTEVYEFLKNRFPNTKSISVYPGLIRVETEDGCSLCANSYRPDETVALYGKLKEAGIPLSVFPKRKVKGCMICRLSSLLIGPEGELYKCWNDLTSPEKIIGHINDETLSNESLLLKYMIGTDPFDDKCKDCPVFPICDTGCPLYRFRNRFEGGDFPVCSPYIDRETLIDALLNDCPTDTDDNCHAKNE